MRASSGLRGSADTRGSASSHHHWGHHHDRPDTAGRHDTIRSDTRFARRFARRFDNISVDTTHSIIGRGTIGPGTRSTETGVPSLGVGRDSPRGGGARCLRRSPAGATRVRGLLKPRTYGRCADRDSAPIRDSLHVFDAVPASCCFVGTHRVPDRGRGRVEHRRCSAG
jgi:hypothetical protein